MDLNTENKKQVDQIFSENKTKIQVIDLQKYLDSKNIALKIPQGIVNSISKQSYSLWIQKEHHKNINKLVLYQIYEKVDMKCKQKPEDIDKNINQYDQKLKKIGYPEIQVFVFKQAINQHTKGHIYTTYRPLLKTFLQNKKAKQSEKQTKKNQQAKPAEKSEKIIEQSKQIKKTEQSKVIEKSDKKIEQQKKNQQVKPAEKSEKIIDQKNQTKVEKSSQHNIEQIFQKYCTTQQISEQNLVLLNKEVGQQVKIERLRQFKASHGKAIDAKETKYTLAEYKRWKSTRQTSAPKTQKREQIEKTEKQIPKEQLVQKQKQQLKPDTKKIDKREKNLENILTKYFKPLKKLPQVSHSFPEFNIQLKLDCTTPIQNSLQYKLKMLMGEKQITKFISDMQQKKLIQSLKESQYYILKIWTKKSEQLEEKIESYVKLKKINTEGCKLRTFTESDKVYVSFQFHDASHDDFLAKIHSICINKNEQNHCKIEQIFKFGLGNEAKQKPEDRKIIKCLSKGFQFNLNILGSSEVNNRFRKNLQLENSDSFLFPLLAISKKSSLKMKWKKIEDVNSFFNKLGVLEVIKTTPSVKQLIHENVKQIFDKKFDIFSTLQTIISQHETSKVTLINVNEKTLAQISLNNMKQFFKK